MQNQYGGALREWRAKRRLSQLDLSLSAGVSSRHIAFLETGRARPSRAMVMQLGEALNVPRAERNRMLDAAGFRPAWTERHQDSGEMAPVMDAMRRIMDRHDPYPAFALDRHWRIVSANQSGAFVLSAFGLETGGSLLDAMMESGRAREMIENWPEVAAHMLTRLRTESAVFRRRRRAGPRRRAAGCRPGPCQAALCRRHASHHPGPLPARRPNLFGFLNHRPVWLSGGHRAR